MTHAHSFSVHRLRQAAVLLAFGALTACSTVAATPSSQAPTTGPTASATASTSAATTSATASGSQPAAPTGILTGTPEEWMKALCGAKGYASLTSGRFGVGWVKGWYCKSAFDAGTDENGKPVETYVELSLYSSANEDLYQADDAGYWTSARGLTSDGQWAIALEDSSRKKIGTAHLDALHAFGFMVAVNQTTKK